VTVFQATWIPGLLLEDTRATGRPSNPKHIGYLREYHKHNWRGMVDYLGSNPRRSCPAVRRAAEAGGQAIGYDAFLSFSFRIYRTVSGVRVFGNISMNARAALAGEIAILRQQSHCLPVADRSEVEPNKIRKDAKAYHYFGIVFSILEVFFGAAAQNENLAPLV
jgi:hypothetical protein